MKIPGPLLLAVLSSSVYAGNLRHGLALREDGMFAIQNKGSGE
jgi:hypothetical protein